MMAPVLVICIPGGAVGIADGSLSAAMLVEEFFGRI